MTLQNYNNLSTERANSRTRGLDRLTPSGIVRLMNREDRRVLSAVAKAATPLAWAIRHMAGSMARGGRVFFVGAGTSGRLGVLEAAECPPTFSTKLSQVQAIMAGGKSAVFRSKEGAEDSEREAVSACRRAGVDRSDIVVGIAASGVTPFVRAALRFARGRKAETVLVTSNPRAPRVARTTIVLRTGPEVLAGSTRLKAATACKMALNILTTGTMVQLGKVYGNRMVDLQPKSRKLVERGVRLIRDLGRVPDVKARRLFAASRGQVKTAIVMARLNCSRLEAGRRLQKAGGFLRAAL